MEQELRQAGYELVTGPSSFSSLSPLSFPFSSALLSLLLTLRWVLRSGGTDNHLLLVDLRDKVPFNSPPPPSPSSPFLSPLFSLLITCREWTVRVSMRSWKQWICMWIRTQFPATPSRSCLVESESALLSWPRGISWLFWLISIVLFSPHLCFSLWGLLFWLSFFSFLSGLKENDFAKVVEFIDRAVQLTSRLNTVSTGNYCDHRSLSFSPPSDFHPFRKRTQKAHRLQIWTSQSPRWWRSRSTQGRSAGLCRAVPNGVRIESLECFHVVVICRVTLRVISLVSVFTFLRPSFLTYLIIRTPHLPHLTHDQNEKGEDWDGKVDIESEEVTCDSSTLWAVRRRHRSRHHRWEVWLMWASFRPWCRVHW